MSTRTTTIVLASLAAVVCAAALAVPAQRASGLPPPCDDGVRTCPDRPVPDDEPDGPAAPEPQPQPPAPWGSPNAFTYNQLAFQVDAGIVARLGTPAPAGSKPWPLATVPFQPEVSGAPVRVMQAPGTTDVWVFSSYDRDGRATFCLPACSDVPELLYNPNYGTYQATMRVRPKLDIEFWQVKPGSPGAPQPFADRLAEVTATLEVRGFAECVGWEAGTARLKALVGTGNVRIQRDTDWWEDLANFFLPNLTSSVNAQIRNGLMTALGVGRFVPISVDGSPCYSLGVRGDGADGAITWNAEPCITPLLCGKGPVVVKQT